MLLSLASEELYSRFGPMLQNEDGFRTSWLPAWGAPLVRGRVHPLTYRGHLGWHEVDWRFRRNQHKKVMTGSEQATELDPATIILAYRLAHSEPPDTAMWDELVKQMGLRDPNGPRWTGETGLTPELATAIEALRQITLPGERSARIVHRHELPEVMMLGGPETMRGMKVISSPGSARHISEGEANASFDQHLKVFFAL